MYKYKNGKEYKNNNLEYNLDFMYYGNNINDKHNMIEFTEDDYKQEVLFLSYRKRSFLFLYIFEIFSQLISKRLYKENNANYIMEGNIDGMNKIMMYKFLIYILSLILGKSGFQMTNYLLLQNIIKIKMNLFFIIKKI